jgi:predicted RNA-binding Zn ribbon-like protein
LLLTFSISQTIRIDKMEAIEERFGPTRRGGPLFRWLGEPLAIDLANTVMMVREGESVDLLADDGLTRWLEAERERLGECAFAVKRREQLHDLRDAVRELCIASAAAAPLPAKALECVNTASAEAPVSPQLLRDESGSLEITERNGPGDPMAQLLARLARSAIELLGGPDRERLKLCTAPSCGMFFLGTRRWCCSACGNRARAARHYRRARTGA